MKTDEILQNRITGQKILVIGNGFDLHCDAKTSYSDFFNASTEIQNFIKSFQNEIKNSFMMYRLNYINDFVFSDDKFNKDVTVWDILFYFRSRGKENLNWCDIEAVMQNTLQKHEKTHYSFWNETLLNINSGFSVSFQNDEYTFSTVLYCFIYSKLYKRIKFARIEDPSIFINFLLEELHKFEERFGQYIKKVCSGDTYFQSKLNTLISMSQDFSSVSGLYSFNYSLISNDNIFDTHTYIKNINGDINNPIFGIDSSCFSSGDPWYVFTKTHRRMVLNGMRKEGNIQLNFENILIYGHSLNRQDYSFFFPLFDYLQLNNTLKTTKVVFFYSIYGERSENGIISELSSNIANLFEAYENYLYPSRKEMRLLDALSIEGRIIISKI